MHPDGLLLGTGGESVRLWDLKTCTSVANMSTATPVISIDFSENGYHLATSTSDSAQIWDLRKLAILHSVPVAGACVRFDASGKYVAFGAGAGISVFTAKKLELVAEIAASARIGALSWREDAKGMVVACVDRTLTLFA
jgi:WD40 repeat protein